MDKSLLDETGKAIMSGYTSFYDTNTKKSWFAPIEIVTRDTVEKIDGTEEILNEFDDNEICKAVFSCYAINGAQKRNVEISDFNEKTQKAIKLGLMSEAQAIRNAGGQVYGKRIQEFRFAEIINHSEHTAFTLEDCMKKPIKEEDAKQDEPYDIFGDSDDDI